MTRLLTNSEGGVARSESEERSVRKICSCASCESGPSESLMNGAYIMYEPNVKKQQSRPWQMCDQATW